MSIDTNLLELVDDPHIKSTHRYLSPEQLVSYYTLGRPPKDPLESQGNRPVYPLLG